MSEKILDVYLHERFAGELCQDQSGKLLYTYDPAYLAGNYPALSISLPLQAITYEGKSVKAFFSGLLPDENLRFRLARYLGVSDKNPFALLKAIGVECAGAISLYPQGNQPEKITSSDIEVLDEQRLSDILSILKRHPLLAGEDGIRLSLAGAQDKIAVGLHEGKIALVKGARPTTHILKPVIEAVQDSVHNELFCMRLAKQLGIEAPHVEIRYSGKQPLYLIERYDRIINENGQVHRLHQEDFCQALGIMPEFKYENEGGPTFAQSQDLLKNHSGHPGADQIKLLKRLIFNYLIGNADAHGKNSSVLYKKTRPELAPAYDLLCTAIYPGVSKKMAMKIGGKYLPNDVFLRHWHRIVSDTAVARKNIEKQLFEMADECLDKAHDLKDNLRIEGIASPIFDEICAVIEERVKHIKIEQKVRLD